MKKYVMGFMIGLSAGFIVKDILSIFDKPEIQLIKPDAIDIFEMHEKEMEKRLEEEL